MKTKTFDCVRMMHAGARKVREMTRAMASEEQVAFWRGRTKQLRQRQRHMRKNPQ